MRDDITSTTTGESKEKSVNNNSPFKVYCCRSSSPRIHITNHVFLTSLMSAGAFSRPPNNSRPTFSLSIYEYVCTQVNSLLMSEDSDLRSESGDEVSLPEGT